MASKPHLLQIQYRDLSIPGNAGHLAASRSLPSGVAVTSIEALERVPALMQVNWIEIIRAAASGWRFRRNSVRRTQTSAIASQAP